MTLDIQGVAGRRLRLSATFAPAVVASAAMPGGVESLFAHLISRGRISPAIMSVAKPRKRRRRSSPAPLDLPRGVLDHVRGTKSDADLWATWRFFARPLKSYVWLTGMAARPELNGTRASVISFDTDAARIGVQLCHSLETLHLSGHKLAWCPPEPSDVTTTAAILAKVIGAEAAAIVCGHLFCGRCERPCAVDARCEVPHPPSRRLDLTGHAGWAPFRLVYYLCLACGGLQWRKAGEWYGAWEDMESSAPCWEGKHVTARLTGADGRRFHARHPKLINNPYLWDDIEALSESTVSLRISEKLAHDDADKSSVDSLLEDSGSEADDEAFELACALSAASVHTLVSLDDALPNLEELYLEDVGMYVEDSRLVKRAMRKLDVSDYLFPNLKVVSLVSMDSRCVYTFNTSSLKVMYIRDWDSDAIRRYLCSLIEGSTALEELHAPGLSIGILAVASNTLSLLDVRNATDLGSLTLWTPNLKVLNVQSCNLTQVQWLREHRIMTYLPPDHVTPPLLVRNGSSNVETAMIQHPNVSFSAEITNEEYYHDVRRCA